MASFLTFLLLHVFTAVLPPPSDDNPEDEYYHVLGFDSPSLKRIGQEDIRKAYRALSLQLHPDKIAQRGGNAAEAAAKYEKVQQAYAVLSDKTERQKYHAVNCSVKRYKFVYQQGWMHPMNLLQNLSAANCVDKFRLVLVVGFVLCLVLLQPILLAAKVNAVLSGDSTKTLYDTNWNVIWIPFYALYGLATVLQMVMFALTKQRDILLTALQQVCILVGIGFVSHEWDQATDSGRPMDSVNWFKLATPFYLALAFRVAALSEGVKALASFHGRLVSPDKMVEIQHSKGHLTEEQMEALRAEYVICTPNDLEVATTLAVLEQANQTIDDEDIEAIKVTSSPEFQHLQKQISKQQTALVQTLVYGILLITLICAKIESKISCSWWVVFVPLWVFLGVRLLRSCCTCCLAGFTASAHEEEEPEEEIDDDKTRDHEDEPNTRAAAKAAATTTKPTTDAAKPPPPHANEPKQHESAVAAAKGGNVVDEKKKEATKKMPKSQTFPKASKVSKPAAAEDAIPKSKTFSNSSPVKQSSSSDGQDAIEERKGHLTSLKGTPEFSTKFETAQSTTFFESAVQKEHIQEEEEAQKSKHDDDEPTVATEDIPELDEEEAFRQWQRQHAQEADNDAMEAAASAQWTCCTSLFQLVTACLIVAKLQDAYDSSEEEEEGLDAYWILFPIFLVAFIVLCCCCCLLYSTPDVSKMEEFIQAQQAAHAGGDEEQGGAAATTTSDPILVPPPSSQPEQPAASAAASSTESVAASSQHDVESGTPAAAKPAAAAEDINDLD